MMTAGKLLIISGVGIPIVSVLVTVITNALNPNVELVGLLFLVTTYPVIFLPLWVIPIIGGIFALKEKHNAFMLVSSYIALVYWAPFLFMVYMMVWDRTINYLAYLLYLLPLVAAVLAFAQLTKHRKIG